MSWPVILFQGLEDEVVPPSQAEVMAESLERNVTADRLGTPHSWHPKSSLARLGEPVGHAPSPGRIDALD
jgi:hypothetical protein